MMKLLRNSCCYYYSSKASAGCCDNNATEKIAVKLFCGAYMSRRVSSDDWSDQEGQKTVYYTAHVFFKIFGDELRTYLLPVDHAGKGKHILLQGLRSAGG